MALPTAVWQWAQAAGGGYGAWRAAGLAADGPAIRLWLDLQLSEPGVPLPGAAVLPPCLLLPACPIMHSSPMPLWLYTLEDYTSF